ncbi:MAG TPA: cyanophycin synthetase, partial [Bacteroidales bacterium]|nr:cyanophycin synthetase [Bacteroidales bacterium]
SKIVFADAVYRTENFHFVSEAPYGSICNILHGEKPTMKDVYCALGGIYQQENIQTVLAACDELSSSGYKTDEKIFRKGLKNVIKNTGLQGRWQVLSEKPLTICDTGHNKDGLKQVVQQIRQMNFNKLHFVFGMVSDKDIPGILKLLPKNATYYFCKPDIPRGLDAEILKKEADAVGLSGKTHLSVSMALKAARENAKEEDMVFVGGSTFVVAEVL